MLTRSRLKKLPARKISAAQLVGTSRKKSARMVARAAVQEYDGERILVVSVSAMEPLWAPGGAKRFTEGTIYAMKDGIQSRLTYGDEAWWSTAALGEIMSRVFTAFVSDREEKVFNDILNSFLECSFERPIGHYDDRIHRIRREQKYKSDIERIRGHMSRFSDNVPKDMPKYIKKAFREESYVFFSNSKKEQTGYCTYCGKEFFLKKHVRHNDPGKCPCCHTPVTYKNEKLGRGKLVSVRWTAMMDCADGDVLIRYFRHVRILQEFRNPEIRSAELQRVILRQQANGKVRNVTYEKGDFKNLGVISWRDPLRNKPYWYTETEWDYPLHGVEIYRQESSMKKLLREIPWLRYSAADLFAAAKPLGYGVELYMQSYPSSPWLEKLVKCGFANLVADAMQRYGGLEYFSQETELHRILGVSHQGYKLLAADAGNVLPGQIKLMRKYEEMLGHAPSEKDWKELNGMRDAMTIVEILSRVRNITLHKLCRYLNAGIHARSYLDYIGWLSELKVPMTEFTLCPLPFNQAHDQRYKEVQQHRKEEEEERLRDYDRRLREARERISEEMETLDNRGAYIHEPGEIMRSQKYLIRLPESIMELDREGAELHHCVSTYKARVLNGTTTILFIRKVEDPDKPFVTAEWKDSSFVQIRARNNNAPDPEVQAFADVFSNLMQKSCIQMAI